MTDISIKDKSQEAVLITGVTGYIATECCKVLADKGWANVRGTTRNVAKAEKLLKQLIDYCSEKGCTVELVEADLGNAESIEQAVGDF